MTFGSRDQREAQSFDRRLRAVEQRTQQIPSRIGTGRQTAPTNAITQSVTQTAHGFTAGKAVGVNVTTGVWSLAAGDGEYDTVGLVTEATANTFTVCLEGEASYSGATVNALHYLSDGGAGVVSTTRPTDPLSQVRAVFYGLTADTVYVLGTGLILSHEHELYRLFGVDPTTRPGVVGGPVDGDVLTYDAGTGLYKAMPSAGTIADNAVTNAKLRDSAACSVIGRAPNTVGDPADIVAGTDDRVLARFSGSLQFLLVQTAMIDDNVVTDAEIRDAAACSVIGRSANSVGDPADITAASNGQFMRRKANVLGFGTIETTDIGATPATAKMLLCSSASAHDWFAMSGDATIGATGALTLANSGATAGTTGSATIVPVITVDVKGRITAVTTATITPASIGAVDSATFSAHTHSTGGDISGNLATVSVDKIKGKAVPATPADKTFMRFDTATSAWTAYVLPITTRGDLLTVNTAGDLQRRAIGTNGQYLKTDGLDATWALPLIDDCDDVLITSLASGDLLQYDAVTSDWVNRTVDTVASGTSKLLPMGGFGTQTSRTTTGTHNFTAGKKFCMAVIRGSGGGGAGGSSVLGSGSYAGGGGGEGEKRIIIVPIGSATTASVTIGAVGTGGATDASGTAGGDTSITINGTTYTAKGGGGATGSGGGAGGASTSEPGNSNGLNITVSGLAGQHGRIVLINYNASGNITSYTNSFGAGGGGAAPRGTGGAGGAASSAGSSGIAGSVEIYER